MSVEGLVGCDPRRLASRPASPVAQSSVVSRWSSVLSTDGGVRVGGQSRDSDPMPLQPATSTTTQQPAPPFLASDVKRLGSPRTPMYILRTPRVRKRRHASPAEARTAGAIALIAPAVRCFPASQTGTSPHQASRFRQPIIRQGTFRLHASARRWQWGRRRPSTCSVGRVLDRYGRRWVAPTWGP